MVEKNDERTVIATVKDLGMAAYLKLVGFKFISKRKNNEFNFEINESEQEHFEEEKVNFLNSQFAAYDSEIMNLKKI